MKHTHHIIPRHMGGTDAPSNLIKLTIEEHALAHFNLWKQYGHIEDKIAWQCLSGRTITEKDRISLSKSGFKKFLSDKDKVFKWKCKISNTLKGRKQSQIIKMKKSYAMKMLYKEGKIKPRKFNPEVLRQNYYSNNMAEKLAEGRRSSEKWKQSVSSEEYKLKKVLADPRSKKVCINGIIYNSIREASRNAKINYSKLRTILLTNIDNNIFFC